jgi:hypothetical protein
MTSKALTSKRRDDDFARDESIGELDDAIRRLHAVVVAANAMTTDAHVGARSIEVARVLLVLAESLAAETLALSRQLVAGA